jgi:hypothetical protein
MTTPREIIEAHEPATRAQHVERFAMGLVTSVLLGGVFLYGAIKITQKGRCK